VIAHLQSEDCRFGRGAFVKLERATKSINTLADDESSDRGLTDLSGMGMGLLRWLLWPRRAKDEEEPPRRRRSGSSRGRAHQPGVYRIEVDNEAGRFHGDGPPFSFWSSSRVILILSFLLWWIQPAGPMIAGYVGGRRAGSPIKAVIAALMPVFAIYVANAAYAHNFASHQIDFVASLPMVVSDGISSILPFLVPYKEFMVAYMKGFVEALTTTFGMGTNGYLMVIIFAYIGGLIAEQTRRELVYRSGSGSSVGVNLVQPILGARPYIDEDEEAYDEDEEIRRSRRPVRARARGHPAAVGAPDRVRHRRGHADYLDYYRKVPAEVDEYEGGHRLIRVRHRDDEDPEDDEGEEVVVSRTHRVHPTHSEERHEHRRTPREREDDEEAESRGPPARATQPRSQAEERAIQRFVERALRNYDHSKL
jgi:hypothetical protein